jgi:teichuronic acid biosynthesis glycosyltransferase TuaH
MNHHFIRNRDIVFFSFQPWESPIGSNFKDMALELCRFNRVLFVNRAADRNSVLHQMVAKAKGKSSPAGKRKPEYLSEIQPNLWLLNPQVVLESINWSPSHWLFDQVNRINNRSLSKEINKGIEKLGFKEIIFVNDNDFFRGLYQKEMVPCETYIYYLRDFLTVQSYFKKFGPQSEKQMFLNADLVVANSAYLAQYAKQYNPHSFDIGQGCFLEPFLVDGVALPEDLQKIPRPIIGYCGAITSMRLDIEVLEQMAQSLRGSSIVLVGPADQVFEKSNLKNYSNVFLLGGKPPGCVQNYINHFDICINPQSINPLTIGNYPRKVDEYLAAGKPVVATATQAMDMFKDYAFLCHTKEEFIDQINMILSKKSLFSPEEKQRRRSFALQHTWENSIGCLGDAYFLTRDKNQSN